MLNLIKSKLSNIRIPTTTVLLILLLVTSGVSLILYEMANSQHPVVISSMTTFYTPGQHRNCKWVLHISDTITTFPGETSSVQIGIPDVIKDGYLSGILQNGPGNTLLLAFSLPNQPPKAPPIIMTASYTKDMLPIKNIRFRVFNSTALTMNLYHSYDACVEATME